MEQYILKDQEILKDCRYISEIPISYLYEKLTGYSPSEYNGYQYNHDLLRFINKSSNFKFLFKFSSYEPEFSFEGSDEEEINSNLIGFNNNSYFFYYSKTKDLLIKLFCQNYYISLSISSKNLDKINEFLEEIKKFEYVNSESEIGIILATGNELRIKRVKLEPVKVNVEINYGEKFLEKHNIILDKINNRRGGLFIFSGAPGTGKSNYIKYLAQNSKRLFVFIPISMVESLVSPDLIGLLLDNPDAVLILEDAEKAVIDREQSNNPSLVSTLLNLSDGILTNMLGTSIIVTFNTDRNLIDKALLRKGRLFVEHSFNELSSEEANKVAQILGKNIKFDKCTSLGEIYNYEEQTFHKEKETKSIGFSFNK